MLGSYDRTPIGEQRPDLNSTVTFCLKSGFGKMMRPTPLTALAVLVTALTLTATAGASTRPFYSAERPGPFRISGGGEVAVRGSAGLTGMVRVNLVFPRTWKRTSKRTSRTLKLLTPSSCGHVATLTPNLTQGVTQSAAARAAALLPATGRYVMDTGTRRGSAFRVVRDRRSNTVRGVLVTPLASAYSPGVPSGQTVYAQISAVATANPKRECHSGGPRSVAAALGDAFAIGGAGGFVIRK